MKRSTTNLIFWTALPIVLGLGSVSLVFNFLERLSFRTLPVTPDTQTAKVVQLIPAEPGPKYFYADKQSEPSVSAKAYLVGDLDTGEVILAKNPEEAFPIASVSKLMTALVADLIAKPEDTASVSKTALATAGKSGELSLGEKFKVTDLLYPLLLESSNDAAEVIAQFFGRDAFMEKMNLEAKKLMMDKTSYKDPSGLSPENTSTVSDLFKLIGFIRNEKPELIDITHARSHTVKKHSWSNISQFLRDDGYLGGKSGYTIPAKQTVISLFSVPLGNGTRPIAIVLLQSKDRRQDVETIVKYLKRNIYYGGEADAVSSWIKERVSVPDIKQPAYVTLALGGDVMLARGVKSSVVKNFNNDYSALFQNADVLKKADIVYANLEGPASDQGSDQKNLYSFRMDPSVVPALKGAGFSILSVANNHMNDWGRAAFEDTLAALNENEIAYVGGGQNLSEAETPQIIEKYGLKIGFLAFSDKGPEALAAGSAKSGILLASDPDFDSIIRAAAKEVDYLIVAFHFGEEYEIKHNKRQSDLAHRAINDGAKIVVGAHPHVVEDTEIYQNGFIAYSLGNLIFDQPFSKDTMQGEILEMKLWRNGDIAIKKDQTILSPAFQISKIIEGQEEKIKFNN